MESNRLHYKSIFKEILNNSVKSNCLCHYCQNNKRGAACQNGNVFDNYGAFLEDDDETKENKPVDDEPVKELVEGKRICENESMICDTSCFERLQLIYKTLSSCLNDTCTDVTAEEKTAFLNSWSKCILSKHSNAVDYFGSSIYHYAALQNNLKLLKCLLEINPDAVHLCDSRGMTILTRACQKNHMEMVEYLLRNTAANPNGSVECIYTPLLVSITGGNYAQAKLLLDYNAYPSYINHLQSSKPPKPSNQFNLILSPLRAAIIYEKLPILSLLLKYGADVDELVVNGTAPMTVAKYSDYLNCVNLLYRHLNQQNFEYMIELNEYLENVSVYRNMAISFQRSVQQYSVDSDEVNDAIFQEFRTDSLSVNTLMMNTTQAKQCEYIMRLVRMFYNTKSLKELARFSIRKHIMHTDGCILESIRDLECIPKPIRAYILHE